jgi:thiol-disulfide isomerase/thioredoxin
MRRRSALLLALALSLAAGLAGATEPALALADLAGRTRRLDDLQGRVVVLNFWATWCVPCRVEMPLLVRLHREYASRGVEVVGASADDETTRAHIAPLLAEAGIGFPIWVGATTADMERLGLGTALPATAIVDRDGRIAFRLRGPLAEADLRQRLEWLLGPRSVAAPPALVDTFARHVAADDHADDDHGHPHAEDAHDHHEHADGEEHQHGAVALEGASLVPS